MEKKFFRECPSCNKQLGYTNKKNRNTANRRLIDCSSCSHRKAHQRPEVILKTKKRALDISKRYRGEGNPFFGRKHSDSAKKKIIENRDLSNCKTDAFKDKMSKISSGKNNPMYGKTYYDVWVEKYGKEEADKKMEILSKKKSLQTSGKNNPMYGKPSPQGSGNGWSGWYKGWYFRSLKELSYMVNVVEKKGIRWKSAEKGIKIRYKDYKGSERTYRPDFILESKILIEIKPKKLMDAPNNIRKKIAAIEFCKNHNMQYRMVDVKLLDEKQLRHLYESKSIKFLKKYEEKYLKYIQKQDKNNDK